MIFGIFNANNDVYHRNKELGKQREDYFMEYYSSIIDNFRPIFLRYLDLIPEMHNDELKNNKKLKILQLKLSERLIS